MPEPARTLSGGEDGVGDLEHEPLLAGVDKEVAVLVAAELADAALQAERARGDAGRVVGADVGAGERGLGEEVGIRHGGLQGSSVGSLQVY